MKKRGEIKVLLVEDRADDAELLLAEMRRRGLPVVSLRVETEPAFTDALRHFEIGRASCRERVSKQV